MTHTGTLSRPLRSENEARNDARVEDISEAIGLALMLVEQLREARTNANAITQYTKHIEAARATHAAIGEGLKGLGQ